MVNFFKQKFDFLLFLLSYLHNKMIIDNLIEICTYNMINLLPQLHSRINFMQ